MGLLDEILASMSGGTAGVAGAQSSPSSLSTMLNSLGGGNQAQSASLLTAAMSMLQQHGGLSGVLDMFRQSGMSQHADSWVGTGANMPISADQVQQVFGEQTMTRVASQLGQSPGQAGSLMAQLLPGLINHLTPQGQVPQDNNDMISKALGMLRSGLG